MPKSIVVVGIGDFKVTNNPDVILKTIALGSCVGIVLFCKKTNVIGMAHIALPSSSINPEKAAMQPAYFADTGIPALLKGIRKMGGSNDLIAKLAGGASILDEKNFFNIGNRNINSIKQILRSLNISVKGEDIGGHISRTVSVNVENRKLIISHKNNIWEI